MASVLIKQEDWDTDTHGGCHVRGMTVLKQAQAPPEAGRETWNGWTPAPPAGAWLSALYCRTSQLPEPREDKFPLHEPLSLLCFAMAAVGMGKGQVDPQGSPSHKWPESPRPSTDFCEKDRNNI